MEPIRVLQVATIMNRGGLETMLMNYYRKIDKDKIQFDFMVHRQERGHYDDEIEGLGGRIYRMPEIRPGNYNKYFRALDEFFQNHKEYNVVHSHINENSGFVLRAAKKYGIHTRIAHRHLSDLKLDYKYPFRLYGKRYIKGNANHFFACSEKAGQWLFSQKTLQGNNVVILNNAVDTESFQYNPLVRKKLRAELNIEDKYVIGHVGRFNPQKNHDFLVEVFNEVYKKNSSAVLLLIGEGYLMDNIKKKVESMGLTQAVKFLGVRNDISELMQAMDIFMFPSLFEGLPVVLVEAQAAGLRCITSTGVTKEADITNNVEFINLKEKAEVWAERILNGKSERNDTKEKLINKGYDAKFNSKILIDYYSRK